MGGLRERGREGGHVGRGADEAEAVGFGDGGGEGGAGEAGHGGVDDEGGGGAGVEGGEGGHGGPGYLDKGKCV